MEAASLPLYIQWKMRMSVLQQGHIALTDSCTRDAFHCIAQPCLTAYCICCNTPVIQAFYQALQISVILGKCDREPIIKDTWFVAEQNTVATVSNCCNALTLDVCNLSRSACKQLPSFAFTSWCEQMRLSSSVVPGDTDSQQTSGHPYLCAKQTASHDNCFPLTIG